MDIAGRFLTALDLSRTSYIENFGTTIRAIEIVDGIQNLMPYGVDQEFQMRYGNLVDAYKKSELTESGMGIYYLSSIPTDRAEPSEGLRATVAWTNTPPKTTLLSTKQINGFLNGKTLVSEKDIRGKRGAFLLNYQFILEPQVELSWEIVTDLSSTKLTSPTLRLVFNRIKSNRNWIQKLHNAKIDWRP